ncbi:tRNA uridine-5-carboxymethylaminomethyl(34) synthesis GTPase MnmE [Sideroxydans lithotrophicus]|uniref:tRNA modification GTPase MnmE n=1 Tax=Sideroxydans lithotrophicus (strain ES-1) TaxID=580332 RepID=D5CQJ7_SIDLE|nr:tRNA uridine-5-carboxymethylaminomethyl(34) synthesis GTPase MnmE [Sideroxydans lithotrophicus]ADE13218.1 tRNA modification GTPase TrmE [Sideroxydans lithotrophicus ES-1]
MSLKPDNIAAIATAPGRGGIGVVRVSGSGLAAMAIILTGNRLTPRLATYTSFLAADGSTLDQGICLFFPAPHSYTGEEVLELQGHGGPAVLQSLLHRCLELGARLAQPGEFTQRAFLNDKMDLAQAESVADLIDATTEQAARSAMRSLQGEFSAAIHHAVSQLIDLRMLVEATLDFPEEEIETADRLLCASKLNILMDGLARIAGLAKQGSILREGAQVVLVGAPNAGKSSLLNRFAGEEIALVSEIPGTTRDSIRQALQVRGVPLHLIDTAGLRETNDAVEQMGIARTKLALTRADVVLVLLDESRRRTEPEDFAVLAQLPAKTPCLYLHNKVDLSGHMPGVEIDADKIHIYLSAKTGAGMEVLEEKLLESIGWHQETGVFMARTRHLEALATAGLHLEGARQQIDRPEIFAEELRHAQEALSSITGEFSADDLLGEIFSRFCIGK